MFREFKEEAKEIFIKADRILTRTILVLFAIWILSGIYVVEANQVGLIRRFGAVLPVTFQPGIHYHLPWPIDKIDKISIREVKGMDVGFFPAEDMDPYGILLPYCITGDVNIIHNRYIIQYRISDPAKYKFNHKDPDGMLYSFAQDTILNSIASRNVDPVLTTLKREIAEEIRSNLQRMVDDAGLGISVVSIDTKMIAPPENVQSSFQEVVSAQSEKSTAIHTAENEKNKIVPQAKANANNMVEEARAYKYNRISEAQGETDAFLRLLSEYKRAPKVTRDRLYLQMIEKVIPNVKVIVLATDDKGKPVKLKLFRGAMPTQPIIPDLSE